MVQYGTVRTTETTTKKGSSWVRNKKCGGTYNASCLIRNTTKFGWQVTARSVSRKHGPPKSYLSNTQITGDELHLEVTYTLQTDRLDDLTVIFYQLNYFAPHSRSFYSDNERAPTRVLASPHIPFRIVIKFSHTLCNAPSTNYSSNVVRVQA